MNMEQSATEDLKAFERRLIEVIDHMQPTAGRWRAVLLVSFVCFGYTSYCWISDPVTSEVSLLDSLQNHSFFCISLILLSVLFCLGIHKRVVAPSIIASRCRHVLSDFNMSCDDSGKLILKPRPTTP